MQIFQGAPAEAVGAAAVRAVVDNPVANQRILLTLSREELEVILPWFPAPLLSATITAFPEVCATPHHILMYDYLLDRHYHDTAVGVIAIFGAGGDPPVVSRAAAVGYYP